MTARDRLVLLGTVARAHGVQGEVSVRVEDDDLAVEIVHSQSLWVELPGQQGAERAIEGARRTAKGVNVKFVEVDERDAAQALRGARLLQRRSRLTSVDADELFTGDLLGLEARTKDGERLGRVDSLGGGGEILILEIATAEGELQVPLAEPFVHEILLEEGVIVLTPPTEFVDGE